MHMLILSEASLTSDIPDLWTISGEGVRCIAKGLQPTHYSSDVPRP